MNFDWSRAQCLEIGDSARIGPSLLEFYCPFGVRGSLNHEKEITSNTLKAKKTKFKNVKESKKPMMIKKGGSLRGIAFKTSIIN